VTSARNQRKVIAMSRGILVTPCSRPRLLAMRELPDCARYMMTIGQCVRRC